MSLQHLGLICQEETADTTTQAQILTSSSETSREWHVIPWGHADLLLTVETNCIIEHHLDEHHLNALCPCDLQPVGN